MSSPVSSGPVSSRVVEVAAPAQRVMAVIADFPSYPEWADGIASATVVRRDPAGRGSEVEFVLDAGVFSDTYVLEYRWDDAGDDGSPAVHWELLRSRIQRGQQGSYLLEPCTAGTRVTYRLAVELAIPMLGALRRKAEQAIMSTALEGLKRRVEALQAPEPPA